VETSAHNDVCTLWNSISVDGNLSRSDSVCSALHLVQGDWIDGLLRGTRGLVPGSYVTLTARGAFTEVLLDSCTSGVLKAIKAGLHLDSRTFRRLIKGAVRWVSATTMCLVRITSLLRSYTTDGGGKSKQKREHFDQDSASSCVAFSIDAGALLAVFLAVFRNNTHVNFYLGGWAYLVSSLSCSPSIPNILKTSN